MSAAPPSLAEITAVPHACASAIAIPKSSLAGKTSARALSVETAELLVADRTGKGHVRRRPAAQLRAEVPVPDDRQTVRQVREGGDDEIGPLVADEAPDVEEVLSARRRRA